MISLALTIIAVLLGFALFCAIFYAVFYVIGLAIGGVVVLYLAARGRLRTDHPR